MRHLGRVDMGRVAELPTEVMLNESLSKPVVSVPLARVVYTPLGVKVRYVLSVSYHGRNWTIQRGYSEIRSFYKQVHRKVGGGAKDSLPGMPPRLFRHWKTNESWKRIETRRLALNTFFQKLSLTEMYYHDPHLLNSLLETGRNMQLDLSERGEPPMFLETTWFVSARDVCLATRETTRKTTDVDLILPEGVALCIPSGSVRRVANGIIITFRAVRGTSRVQQRAKLHELTATYGWVASVGDRLPPTENMTLFLRHVARFRRKGILPITRKDSWAPGEKEGLGSTKSLSLPQGDPTSSVGSNSTGSAGSSGSGFTVSSCLSAATNASTSSSGSTVYSFSVTPPAVNIPPSPSVRGLSANTKSGIPPTPPRDLPTVDLFESLDPMLVQILVTPPPSPPSAPAKLRGEVPEEGDPPHHEEGLVGAGGEGGAGVHQVAVAPAGGPDFERRFEQHRVSGLVWIRLHGSSCLSTATNASTSSSGSTVYSFSVTPPAVNIPPSPSVRGLSANTKSGIPPTPPRDLPTVDLFESLDPMLVQILVTPPPSPPSAPAKFAVSTAQQ
ncbi:hypothetical protein DIPPA_35343 [Diplonema papillatum]|nr:hypothetical protein DIPPA_35343 [Diplonema papillatum]